jgi:hypothetical protein
MSGKIEAEKLTTAPGEGERRAQRGYVPQYDLAARVIYEALAAGRLQCIGVADRGAGAFDDLVLGLRDRIAAYQIKSSRDPEPFSIRTILLGGGDLLGRMLESRRKLHAQYPDVLIETVYACDDYPRTNDSIAEGDGAISSAAFLRAHEARRLSWTLADWRASPFAGLIAEVFVLGTQRLDLEGMPPAVSDQAKEQGRCVVVTPLPREAVTRLADAAGVPADVDMRSQLNTELLQGGGVGFPNRRRPDRRRTRPTQCHRRLRDHLPGLETPRIAPRPVIRGRRKAKPAGPGMVPTSLLVPRGILTAGRWGVPLRARSRSAGTQAA